MSKYLPNNEINVSDLPSRGLSYSKNATVKYLYYSFGEVQKSTVSSFADLRGTINTALDGIIPSNGFDKTNLTLFDVFFIGLHRKTASLGSSKFTTPYICKKCETKQDVVFNHGDIEFKDVSDLVIENGLPLVVEIDGRDLEFSFLTVGDFLTHFKEREKMPVDVVMAAMVKNMPFKEAHEIIKNTRDPEVIKDLQEVDRLLTHDILPIEATCENPKCGHKNRVVLQGREALLRPFRDGKESPRRSIRFGKKQSGEPVRRKEDGVHGSNEPTQKT